MCPYDMIDMSEVGDECNASKKRMNFILRKCKASADYGCPEWHLISSNIFVQVWVWYKLLGQDCCGLSVINKKMIVAGKYDTASMDFNNSPQSRLVARSYLHRSNIR